MWARFTAGAFGSGVSSTEKLRFLLFLCVIAALPFQTYYSSLFFVLLALTTVIDLNRTRLKALPRQFWIFQVVFFLGVAGYFYSMHRNVAGHLLERQLSILLIPLLLPLAFSLNERLLRVCLWALTATCLVAVIILFMNVIHVVHLQIRQPLSAVFSGPFFNHQFSRPLGIHAGYLSLFIALSMFHVLAVLRDFGHWLQKVGLLLILLLFLGALIFLASRNTIIAVVVIFTVVFPLMELRRKWTFLLVSLAMLAVCLVIIYKVPYLRSRFTIELLSDIMPVEAGKRTDFYNAEPRMERWRGGLELAKRSPVIGYGTGDEIAMLKTQYAKRGLFISYVEDFNAHNQYLSYLLKNGIVGLLVFVGAFVFYLYLAFRTRSFVYVAFLILLLCAFYTENILDANKGIVFFALFNTLFGYLALQRMRGGASPQDQGANAK
jgi:O-antigen ligase